ncbi:MAG: hypothetical protein MI743_11945, partial [Sneathiellales bacterium]|nr:hypothetical protein [Sneathiellales bacterium]
KIKETIPDKPIRFVVQSHHHGDHLAGIREYIGKGLIVVTTPATARTVEKINQTNHYGPSNGKLVPKLKLVNRTLCLRDNSLTANIIDMGPTLHSDEMLIIHFPNERILFQADMVNYGEWPVDDAISIEFSQKIKNLNIPVDMIVGVHGRIMGKREVNKFLNGSLQNEFGN